MAGRIADYILGILPFLIAIALMFVVMRRSRRNMAVAIKVNEEIVALTRESLAELREIKEILRTK